MDPVTTRSLRNMAGYIGLNQKFFFTCRPITKQGYTNRTAYLNDITFIFKYIICQ